MICAMRSAYCCETVESADIYMVMGGIFNDYSSAGYSMLLKRNKMIEVCLITIHRPESLLAVESPSEPAISVTSSDDSTCVGLSSRQHRPQVPARWL